MVNVSMNLEILCQNMEVLVQEKTTPETPCIVMLQFKSHISGTLPKQTAKRRWFDSMMNLDIMVWGGVPHLKISHGNTIHSTGHCDLETIRELLLFVMNTYEDRGLATADLSKDHGFVLDTVMENLSFQLHAGNEREAGEFVHQRRRAVMESLQIANPETIINRDSNQKCRNWTAMQTNAGKTLKIAVYRQPDEFNEGKAFATYSCSQKNWFITGAADLITYGISPRPRSGIEHFRLFRSGSVVPVGRWPGQMLQMQEQLKFVGVSMQGQGCFGIRQDN